LLVQIPGAAEIYAAFDRALLARLDRALRWLRLGGAAFRRRRWGAAGLYEFARRLRLHLADRFLEREALARDVGFVE